jgi:hypothetical protein
MNELTGLVIRALNNLRNYAGALTSSGTLGKLRNLLRFYEGVLSSVGTLTRLINNTARTYSGVIGFVGEVSGSIIRYLTEQRGGTLDIAGVYSRCLSILRSLNATLTSSGASSRLLSIGRRYSSTLTPSGIVNKALLKTKSGVLTISGAISYATSVSQRFFAEGRTGTQSFIGSVSRSLSLSRYTRGYLPPEGKWDTSGILDFLGSVVASNKILTKTKDGVLSFAGTVTNLYTGGLVRTYEGAVNFGGVIAFIEIYLKGKLTDAVISFSGTVAGVIFVTQRYTSIGTMQTPVGVVTRLFKITKTYLGTLSLDGAISHLTSKFKDYAGSLSLNSVLEYVKSGGVAAISVLEDGILSLTGTSSRTIAIQKSYGGGPTFQSSYVRNGAFFRTLYSGVAPYAPDMGGGGGMTGGEFYMDLSMGV